MNNNFKAMRVMTLILAVMMIVTSMPVGLLAKVNYDDLTNDKPKFVNELIPVKPAKLENGQTAEELIKNPNQPAIYTLRTDFKAQRGEKYQVDYQPYIASVGAAATDAEKAKVNKPMDLPNIAGYKKPQENFKIDYDTVKKAADGKNKTGDKVNGFRYSDNKEFKYDAISNKIKIKHVFQKLDDFTKYTNPDGSVGDDGALITTQNGNTGSTVQASPLSESDPRRKGFIPEANYINMQVPENAEDFILEYRYNRANYDVVFDTQGGTALPTRTLYYGQEMPKIADADIPTKVGSEFQGWKPSVELKGTLNGVERTYKANEIIAVGTGTAIKNLDANLIMPASKVTFTAVWKDKEKADYAVQFWAEKADHDDGASLADKYDYIGTRVYKDQMTGSRPDLDNVPVDKIVFPDLDKARLAKIWANVKFNRGKDLYLNKFYVYNQALTKEQNKDPENVNLVKSVDATGKTVYNIYYDRQVYDLYFTKSNALPAENTFYPQIWGYDEAKGEVVKKGGPGNPYHYKARFNQLMLGWPNDAMQTKGFSEGMQSFGWGPNYNSNPDFPTHLDTPPYRLNADQFLDMDGYDKKGGYTKKIDKGDGTSIDLKWFEYTILSFGIKQDKNSMPHHMDFWMDGFKDDEPIIRYDLYRYKADTNSDTYAPKYPKVQGFTGKSDNETPEYLDEGGIDAKNDERAAVTPFPAETYTDMYGTRPVGQMKFIKAFFNNGDEWGDPDGWDGFDTNGYLKFEYKRNKYPLRFNYDPSEIKGDSEFGATNSLDTFYEFPLKALSPKVDTTDEYKKDKPANLLDNPENLKTLGLTDLIFTDTDGKLKVRRPDNLSNQMVFKGWALDPAGTKLIWENPGEKMPSHPVNLYAKWGEPDYQWKVTFDPDGGNLSPIDEEKVTQKRKTIQVGDKGQEEIKTFAKKEANDGDKQIFTVIQRQKLVEPPKPTKKGYDFMGWEVIRYKKDNKGDYTNEIDNSYRETYKVPELYSFGNDVVSPIYLKAIWVPNDRVDVDVVHHILSLDLSKETKKITETLHNKRTGYLVATSGDKQDEEYILATHKELEEKLPDELKSLYEDYNKRVKANNTFFQTFKVEPEKIADGSGNLVDNPKFKDNVFHFFYRPFRTRDYKVNYIDERFKDDPTNGAIIPQEAVSNGNRHYDARNYRQIPGWKLVSAPQQQLFFDVNEDTNEFLGINGTGKKEITFYYKDVRVIEVPGNVDPPEGYVRVTFKAEKGGSFTDKDGKSVTELHYDVIKGLKSDLLPVPEELKDGDEKVADKYYITPETGKKFIKWDEKPLLNKNTIVDNDTKDFYVFTAKFEWSGLTASGLVRTEAFKDDKADAKKDWSNNFAPTIEQLKAQLVWMEKGEKKDLPAGAVIKLYDETGTELTTDKQVYDLVNEKKAADKDELVRTVKIKAKVTFTDGKDPQELDIPITVYKNVYEALTKTEKPLFLSEAEKGELKDITGEYVKVTVAPTGDMNSKDNKVYYVNKNAWVEIPNDSKGTTALINWTADKKDQNDNGEANGKFDFAKRHKFTEDTVISPRFSQTSELVVHESYKDSKNNWVNDFISTELTKDKIKAAIQVKNGSAVALGDGDTVTIVDDAGKPYADLKAALYEKLQEKDDNGKVSRIENIKVKVEYANGEVQTLTVPVKVIKNIYEAKTKEGKPDYVPDNYVKVTLDPTTKAKDPQKYFFYVNPDAKVLIPGKDPEGVKEAFTRWTMKADSTAADVAGETYKLKDRHQFKEDSTITAQYEEGKIKIIYVDNDDKDKEIELKYHIDGVDYPSEKFGKLNTAVNEIDLGVAKTVAPKFKGYFFSYREPVKGKNYKDPADPDKLDVVKYYYTKKITTKDKSESSVHFPVVFDANTGEFGSDPKDKKTVYVYFDGTQNTPEPVTFEEVREEVEEKYGKPSKANENFIEWQDKADKGSAVADSYPIEFKGWDSVTYEAKFETFYAHYGKASALVKYLDLDGKPIAGDYKIEGVEYPTEKAGTAGEAIDKNVYTATTAPKFTGYKFNRIEINPKDGKYTLKDKTTIKIYYEKDLDVIPAENGTEKPDGYVEVKFVPTEKAKDATEKTFYVNPKKEVTIPIADPVAKATFTFKEWKIGDVTTGTKYNPATPKKFTEKTTVITATYEETKNIIPYDPSATDPMSRPDGYVRVSFAADNGLKLTEQKAYYVKKNAGIKLGNADLVKPKYDVETGYKFDKWDTADDTEIKETDIVITAKATVLKDVDTVEHPNYVKVTFKAGDHGVIKENGNEINEKVYYVNPTKYVHLTAPTPEGNTGYDFAAWKSDKSQSDFSLANFVNYKEDTTITAMFNQKDAVYPKLAGSTKPAGYVEVTFAITGTGGSTAKGEVTTYYVDPNRQVSLKAPKTIAGVGHVFDKWRLGTKPTDQIINPADSKQYSKDTTIYGSFVKLKDIIPATNQDGTPNLQPVDYVAVLFIGGDHANKLDGQVLYYVNPKAGKTIGDLTKPTVTPDTGWKQKADPNAWDVKDSTVIKDYMFVVAQYDPIDDVVPAVKDDGTPNEKPAGYVTVTFKAGDNGKIQENSTDITEKVYYVNPAKYVHLTPPTTDPNASYEFSTWESNGEDFILANNINFKEDTTITAKFNTIGDVIPKTKPNGTLNTKPTGFVDVNFVIEGQGGKIENGQVVTYFVKPNTDVTINPPKTTAEVGYEFEKWEPDTTKARSYTDPVTTVKGSFKTLDEIIPSKNPDGTLNAKPEGYVTVQFLKGQHGVLDGQTTFYVNPKAGKKLEDLDTKGITVVPNPTYKFDKWDKAMDTAITGPGNINVTAEYTQLPAIIKAGPKDTAPAGYVVIIFETDGRGTITGNKAYEEGNTPQKETEIVYFVNPKKGVKLVELKPGATPKADQLAIPSTTPDDPNKYIFDQWRKEIDTETPITRGRVHIAMFKPKVVKLTYDANGATGDVPPVLTVDYGTDVRLAGKGNLAKKDAKFLGWEIDNKVYKAGDPINLKEDKTAYAKWATDDTIIEYNPVNNPTTRPDNTYVRVTFAVEDGLKLTEQKAYYVKKNAKDAAGNSITLGNAELIKPGYEAQTGYKFDKWDKGDTLEIKEDDILVTAKATKLDNVIPEKKVDGTPNEKPTGYKEVVFKVKDKDALKGSLEGVTKFYVNPTEYVTINPPTTKAKTGYEFGGWDKDATRPTVYEDEVNTIEGSFNGLKDVIPKTKTDDSEKPAGYKKVEFVIDPATGGQIVDKEVTVYYVNPAKEVTVPQPKTLAETGYEFEKWDQDTVKTAKMYTDNTTVKGNFKKLDDIVEGSKPKPDGYVTVTFDKGEHGTLSEQKVYYVNPKADPVKILGDPTIVKPEVKAETGYKFTSWSFADTKEILSDITVIAQYKEIADVIPKTTNDDSEKPEGYITVTFVKGDHGELEGNTVFYVNPNKAVVLENKAPTIKPNTGYTSAGWDTTINKAIQYKDGDKITALYNELGDVIPQEKTDGSDKPAGYLTVTFDKGANGELSGKTVYYVKPNKKVTVPAPTVTPSVGFEFEKWDKELTQTFTEQNTTITAKYDPLNDIIPQKKTDGSDRPNGYFTVTFEAVNGSLEGTTVYYVKPNVDIDLTNTADAITKKANIGFTDKGGTWDKELKDKFKDGDVITFNFKALDDVIPKVNPQGGENKIPEGYVTVKFTPTANAVDPTEKVYFVNPKANVTILVADPVGKEVADASGNKYTFNFKLWTVTRGSVATWNKGTQVSGQFIQDTDITAKYNVEYKELIKGPVPKDNVVTGKGDVPNPEDLIKNIFDPNEPNNKDNLPDGTTFTYTNYGKPDVNNLGKTTAKVEVRYPNGKTTVVKVPITVVDYVVPQIGGEKPLVPDSYVKVTVDTTETATPNTRFVKVFWVKPGVEVTLPDILAPTGKTVTNLKTRVTNTNNFIKWKLVGSNPEKFYENEIMDTFTAKESTIVAVYEFNDNIKPVGKNNQLIPKGSDPDAKDFINNPYNDKDPKNKDNLPPGTKFEFVPGTEPDTREPGENKQTTIKVIYPNGEVKEVPVIYNVSGDVVEQTDPNKKPDVPDNFVEVVVDTTDFAKGDSYYVKTYWVNPENIVTIPATIPKDIREGYAFDYWQVDLGRENGTRYRKVIEDRFVRPTYIKACYYKVEVPKPGSDYVVTDVNVFPNEDEYRSKITPPKGKKIARVKIMDQPDVSKPGTRTYAEIEVVYTDGTSATVTVQVYVQRPGETNTRIVYRDRIVEKEKIVEKIIKIKDNQRLKEVRFMQGFEGKFRPHDGLTRAEAAQILANALKQDGYTYNPAYPINYKDVKQKWYTQAIVITTQANVFKGYDDGYFRPEEKISRAEWIATLKRFQQLKDADGNKMGLKANHWATKEVEAAYEEGWLQIYTNGNAKFNANEPITREEVAAVTNKAFGRLIDRTYIMRNDKSVINYKDINPSMWSYVDILCASNSFIHDENVYMSHGIEYIKTIVNNIEGTIIFNVQLKNLEIIQDKFQRYLR